MKLSLLLLLSFMMFASCSERTPVESDTALTEIHLQSGFYGQVIIWVDGEKVYDELMSSQVPLAGPQNQFTLSLNRGAATIKVSWGDAAEQLTDEISVRIGSFDEYYLGMNIVDNSVTIRLQTTQFLYM